MRKNKIPPKYLYKLKFQLIIFLYTDIKIDHWPFLFERGSLTLIWKGQYEFGFVSSVASKKKCFYLWLKYILLIWLVRIPHGQIRLALLMKCSSERCSGRPQHRGGLGHVEPMISSGNLKSAPLEERCRQRSRMARKKTAISILW